MAFVRLAVELEQTLRKMAISHGLTREDAQKTSLRTLADYLRSHEILDQATIKPIDQIRHMRNMTLHSGSDVSAKDAEAAVDLVAAVLSRLGNQ